MHHLSKTRLGGIVFATLTLTTLALRLALAPPAGASGDGISKPADSAVQNSSEEFAQRQPVQPRKVEKRSASVAENPRRDAASQTARSLIACYQLQRLEREAETYLSISANRVTLEQLLGRESELGNIGEQLRKREHDCDSIDPDSVSKDLYPSLLLAARLGDSNAASCYASADFAQNADELQPEKTAEFQKNALAFIDEGMRRGDWRFVQIAADAASRFSVRDHYANVRAWNRHLLPADAIAAYGYERLLRFGMSGELAEQADRSLAAQREALNPDKVDAIEEWAQDQYLKYFQSSPPLTESPRTCAMQ